MLGLDLHAQDPADPVDDETADLVVVLVERA
jgi:hypothetical protein